MGAARCSMVDSGNGYGARRGSGRGLRRVAIWNGRDVAFGFDACSKCVGIAGVSGKNRHAGMRRSV